MTSTLQRTSSKDRGGMVSAWRARMDTPVATYYLLISIMSMLIIIGLIMVLSASTIVSINDSASPYTVFLSQLVFALLGLVVMVIAARLPVGLWKRLGGLALVGALVMQVLVVFTPLGTGKNGNTNWLDLKVFTVQPSEVAKVALVLFGARALAAKRRHLGSFKEALVPFVVPATFLVVALVMLGRDLGTAIVIAALVGGMLFAAGVPLRWFGLAGVGGLGLMALATMASSNRRARIGIWLDPGQCSLSDEYLYYGICRQPMHARYALADGGWTGIGLGASKEKWEWLSEPHNDFIFAIIGEELGLIGTLAVLGLYAAFAYAAYRLVVRTDDFFVRIASAGIMTWITFQAIVNIGAVIGALPIVGVPLPFVSSGGSSLVTTMLAAGILLAFARNEPGCSAQLAARPSAVRGSIAVLSTMRRRTTRR